MKTAVKFFLLSILLLSFALLLNTGMIYSKLACYNNDVKFSTIENYSAPKASNDSIVWCDEDKYYLYATNGFWSTRHQVSADEFNAARIGDLHILEIIVHSPIKVPFVAY